MAKAKLTFGQDELATIFRAPAQGPWTHRRKLVSLFGLQGDLVIDGGRGGRPITIDAYVMDASRASVEAAIKKFDDLVGRVETLTVADITGHTITRKHCECLPLTRLTPIFEDKSKSLLPGATRFYCEVRFEFYQLKDE